MSYNPYGIDRIRISLPPDEYLTNDVRKAAKKLRDLLRNEVAAKNELALIDRQIQEAIQAERDADVAAATKGAPLPEIPSPARKELEAKRAEAVRRVEAIREPINEAKHEVAETLGRNVDAIRATVDEKLEAKSGAFTEAIRHLVNARDDYGAALGMIRWLDSVPRFVELMEHQDYSRIAPLSYGADMPHNDLWHRTVNSLLDEAKSHNPDDQMGWWAQSTDHDFRSRLQ
ncbi:hypothetical protein ACIG5D_36445 [Microbispora rosea]|uniref:hypothetical protein n=1 Tax=Microbispora rosea TaxID=58117 RepID=UPI0037CB7571